jgi:ubiquinone/menaquinone biosynthesis C-methylase UbiE
MSEEDMKRNQWLKQEHPSTYFVQDRSNEDELTRLRMQDEMITTGMGGVLPEQPDPIAFRRVLDVGCGTGGWLLEVAKMYPSIPTLIGVDISHLMVMYASAQAIVYGMQDRVTFQSMDALRMLEFPASFFDLVNQRLGMSYLRVWDWPKLLQEYRRVTCSGGMIRITEACTMIESNSPALTRIGNIVHEASSHAGHLFTSHPDGVITRLAGLMTLHGIVDVQTREYPLVYRAGTPEGQLFAEDMAVLFRVGLPFLQKWTRVPEEYHALCQQAIKEMRQPDFVATWTYLTAWGRNLPRSRFE